MSNPHPFDALIQEQQDSVRVAHAALILAADETAALDIPHYLHRLDALAERVRRVDPVSAPTRVEALRQVLVEEEQFTGDTEDYDDPRNSYLNEVMDRRRGLPIALAAIWIDVGAQLGWGLEGVNFPGHYLVRCPTDDGPVLIAPFDAGRTLSSDELRAMLKNIRGRPAAIRPEHLQTATPLMTLTRMLNNLRAVYTSRQEWGKAMRILSRMLAIEPNSDALKAEYEELARRQSEMN